MMRNPGTCSVMIMYRQGWTSHAMPPRITCPTANIDEQVALVITRYFGPTSSVAEETPLVWLKKPKFEPKIIIFINPSLNRRGA